MQTLKMYIIFYNPDSILYLCRKRTAGTNVVTLVLGRKVSKIEEVIEDPFKVRTGGLVDMKTMKGSTLR